VPGIDSEQRFQPSVSRGRVLSESAIASRSSCEQIDRSAHLGMYRLSMPLVLLLESRCHGIKESSGRMTPSSVARLVSGDVYKRALTSARSAKKVVAPDITRPHQISSALSAQAAYLLLKIGDNVPSRSTVGTLFSVKVLLVPIFICDKLAARYSDFVDAQGPRRDLRSFLEPKLGCDVLGRILYVGENRAGIDVEGIEVAEHSSLFRDCISRDLVGIIAGFTEFRVVTE